MKAGLSLTRQTEGSGSWLTTLPQFQAQSERIMAMTVARTAA